jgi:hypothetical protein
MNEKFMKTRILMAAVVLILAAFAILSAGALHAQTGPSGPTGPSGQPLGRSSRRAIMMQRMAAACSGKALNDPCEMTRANGKTVDGTCQNKHHTEQLVCMPPHHHHHGMGSMGGMATPESAPSPAQ